jgi:hypothetical protein
MMKVLTQQQIVVLSAAVAVATAYSDHLARVVKASKGAHPIFWTEIAYDFDGVPTTDESRAVSHETTATPHLQQTVEEIASMLNRAQQVGIEVVS